MQKRKRNYRSTWNLSNEQVVSSNYYPITFAIYIQDNTTSMKATFFTDRAHGATSLQRRQIEVMLHRRMICDDRHFEFLPTRNGRAASSASKLPKNVKISYKPLGESEFVVWLHKMNEANVTVPIKTPNEFLSEGAHQPTYQELTLSANQLKSEMINGKMIWNGAEPPVCDVEHGILELNIRFKAFLTLLLINRRDPAQRFGNKVLQTQHLNL